MRTDQSRWLAMTHQVHRFSDETRPCRLKVFTRVTCKLSINLYSTIVFENVIETHDLHPDLQVNYDWKLNNDRKPFDNWHQS